MNIFMIRTPLYVVNAGYVGYGWAKVDFSQYQDTKALSDAFKQHYPAGVGRKTKNIERFFNLKKGDIVLVPSSKSVSIGEVQGKKTFNPEWTKDNAGNLVSVDFYKVDGRVLKIARSDFSGQLGSRLKVRTAIANFNEFKDEINRIIDSIKKTREVYRHSSYFSEQVELAEQKFKEELLQSIRQETIWLKDGGRGLEELIREMLEIDGYQAKIKAKNQSSDIADIDIEAQKVDRFSKTYLLIQAKHHRGETNGHGLKQLIAYKDKDDDVDCQKWLITTAKVSDENKQLAEQHNINIMEGEELVDWIYESIPRLSEKTKQALGIMEIPSLLK
ncbi:restriction endonuclease [Neisseria montereyensis]|uniref:Restriction endonuclease n=1 Tax=Neisseria montereyensis TaxID=2973938 RepID=A0ABT2FBH2_9NEIS|nr:restriction endonuclease [Neisseria montereyensis]MCS4533563.1 restriction endonuclease [Neisseria montereyensis]